MKKLISAVFFCVIFATFAFATNPATSDLAPAVGPVADYAEYSVENPFDVMTWSTGAVMPLVVYGSACGYYNNELYASHGRISNSIPYNTAACNAYNPGTNTWTAKATGPTARRMVAAGMMQDGQYLYVVGGRYDATTTVGTNERYNMATNTWQTLAACNPRWAHGGAVVGGYVYVFGSSGSPAPNTSVEKYDPATNTWTSVANLPVGRGWCAGASLNGKVYCIGGSGVNTLYEYDPALNTWTTKAPLPANRFYHWAAGDQTLNKIFVFGGATVSAPTADVLVWDAATNTWSTETSMPAARTWPGVGNNYNGTFYVLGGFDGSAVYYNTNYIGATSPPQINPQVTMTPFNPPIVIPANGGQFSFNAAVTNLGPAQAPFWVWARVKNPDGSYTAPNIGPIQINPPVNVNVNRNRDQNVPGAWAAGTYYTIGYAGTAVGYPALDADSFMWTKSATADGGPWVFDATCYGEPFPGEIMATPTTHTVLSNSPNPFNPSTTIRFALNNPGNVNLTVYDVNGRQVTQLANGYRQAGMHDVTFDGSNLASGVYVYTLTANGQTSTAKMVLMK